MENGKYSRYQPIFLGYMWSKNICLWPNIWLKNKCCWVVYWCWQSSRQELQNPLSPIPPRQGKTGLFQASIFLSCSFYPTGNTALWTFRILAVRMFLIYMKWTDASLLPTRDDFRQNVWHRWERNLSIIFMKDGWPHIKQSHQSIAISSDRNELGT